MINKIIYHRHHIIPKHIGGSDDESNLILLTIEEHAEAHKNLYLTYGRWEDKLAWKALSGQISMKEASNLAILEGAKKGGKSNAINKTGFCGRSKEKMSQDGKLAGKASRSFKNPEMQKDRNKKAQLAIKKDRKNNPEKWKEINSKIGTSISKNIQYLKSIGKYKPSSSTFTSEHGKLKAQQHNSNAICPHCGKEGQYRAMKRWHYENCKNKYS